MRNFTSDAYSYPYIKPKKDIFLYLSHGAMLKIQKDNASLLYSAIKDFISLLTFMCTQLSLSRNEMNAH